MEQEEWPGISKMETVKLSKFDPVPIVNKFSPYIVPPFEIIDRVDFFPFHSSGNAPAELVDRADGLLHRQDLPCPFGGVDFGLGKATLQKGTIPIWSKWE